MAILLSSLGLLTVFTCVLYRRLLQLRQSIGEQWAEFEALLRQRHVLVGELLPQVRLSDDGKMAADSMLMVQRVASVQQATIFSQKRAEGLVYGALAGVVEIAGKTPAFRASPEYRDWHGRLTSIEREISDHGESYNDTVASQNRLLSTFPVSIVGSCLGFELAHPMELDGLLVTNRVSIANEMPTPAPVWQGPPKPPVPQPSAARA